MCRFNRIWSRFILTGKTNEKNILSYINKSNLHIEPSRIKSFSKHSHSRSMIVELGKQMLFIKYAARQAGKQHDYQAEARALNFIHRCLRDKNSMHYFTINALQASNDRRFIALPLYPLNSLAYLMKVYARDPLKKRRIQIEICLCNLSIAIRDLHPHLHVFSRKFPGSNFMWILKRRLYELKNRNGINSISVECIMHFCNKLLQNTTLLIGPAHGDLVPQNVLVDANHRIALIDPLGSRQGSLHYDDLAWFLIYVEQMQANPLYNKCAVQNLRELCLSILPATLYDQEQRRFILALFYRQIALAAWDRKSNCRKSNLKQVILQKLRMSLQCFDFQNPEEVAAYARTYCKY